MWQINRKSKQVFAVYTNGDPVKCQSYWCKLDIKEHYDDSENLVYHSIALMHYRKEQYTGVGCDEGTYDHHLTCELYLL